MAPGARDARLNFRLPLDLKEVIEAATTSFGQTVSEFAVCTLVQTARFLIEQRNVTILSGRERDRFIALLDDADRRPNATLVRASRKYKKHLG